jgi:hypothetical protein
MPSKNPFIHVCQDKPVCQLRRVEHVGLSLLTLLCISCFID